MSSANAKIAALETIIAALTATVATLTARIDTLEKTAAASSSTTTTNTSSKRKAPKEKTARAPTGWGLFMKHVISEMKKASPDAKFKLTDFVAEAKKRQANNGYDEAHWKEQASKVAA